MNWFLLLFLIPAILVPVFLLYGFAGCGHYLDVSAPAPTAPEAPTDLKATATGPDSIKLEWKDNSAGVATFDVKRIKSGDILPNKNSGFVDSGLPDATDQTYHVTAKVAGLVSEPSNESTATTKPTAPAFRTAAAQDIDKILLQWIHTTAQSTKPIRFIITHNLTTPAGGSTDLTTSGTEINPGVFTFTHTVPEGSDQTYQVAAVVDGFEDSVPKSIVSDPSGIFRARPLAFKFDLSRDNPDAEDQNGVHGFCLVQRIPARLLHQSGRDVKITLRGSTSEPLTLDRIYLSQVAAGGDPYDAAADLTPVASAVELQANTPLTLPSITYTLDHTEDLLIAFDLSQTPGQGNVRFCPLTGASSFARGATQEAAVPDRTTGYQPANNNLYLVERIEVS